jgi:hypothetical protein
MSASTHAIAPIEPFWNRLRRITLYPAHAGAMVTIVGLAIAKLAVYLPFGWIWVLLATLAIYKYAFECLRATADGFLEPPEVGMSVEGTVARKQLWLIAIFVVVAAFGIALLGPLGGGALALFLGVSLPGATMTLAMEESLGAALNPAKWIAIFARIGWPYLAVVMLCLVIMFSEGYAAAFAAMLLPTPVAIVAVNIISNYALVMTFHLMGYLIYQYHNELGHAPAAPQLKRLAAKPDPDQELLDEAGALVRDGNPDAATALLRGRLRAQGGTAAVHTQYRKLLRLGDDKAELLRHGREYLNILVAQEKDRPALELLRECVALDPAFAPSDAELVSHLAHAAARFSQPQVTLRLLSGFHKRFPKSKDIPRNYLLVANLLHERMNQDEQALTLLRYLKATYPQHELSGEIDSQLAAIERMLAAAKKN